MKQYWVTAVIIITWIASTVFILVNHIDAFTAILLTFAATFYFIFAGLQRPKE